ncbi:hypothetical protein [Leptospira idonii]|uniref:Uncharacterized protein n=1 Tax=Leptospira idonii TaxID=1193500 RepID=A0A4R9LY75_9LEPT|nr:hypothetical protein [Leptospira idonii]TGN18551.1 hypothetical protein EHS15_14285 [Leptospira idonii]
MNKYVFIFLFFSVGHSHTDNYGKYLASKSFYTYRKWSQAEEFYDEYEILTGFDQYMEEEKSKKGLLQMIWKRATNF